MKIEILNYQLQKELFQSDRSIIYRAIDERDQTPVIIKALNNEYPSAERLARFQYEFEIMRKLSSSQENSPQIIQARDFEIQ